MEDSKNNASGLSARTGDLVHKQLNPHEQEYKLSKLSGIQVHPLTKTLTWLSFKPPQSLTSCKDATFEWLRGTPFGFCLKRAQPTWESHFLKAATRSEKGSAVGGVVVGRVMGGKEEEEAEGKWRKPEKKRRKKVKVSMIVMVKVFMGLEGTGIVEGKKMGVLTLSSSQRGH